NPQIACGCEGNQWAYWTVLAFLRCGVLERTGANIFLVLVAPYRATEYASLLTSIVSHRQTQKCFCSSNSFHLFFLPIFCFSRFPYSRHFFYVHRQRTIGTQWQKRSP